MNFSASVSACLSQYATFRGRASRSEFWKFYLFVVLLTAGFGMTGYGLGMGSLLGLLAWLAFAIPMLAAGSRRLHDSSRSGWWQLLLLTLVGVIVLIVWWSAD